MWTIHQPPSRVTSISKLDIGPSLTRRSGSSPKSTRSPKRRFNNSSGHASRGRCGRCEYYGGEYVRNVFGMAHMRTLAKAKKGIERFRHTGSPYQAHGVD